MIALLQILLFLPAYATLLIAHRGVHHTYGETLENGCRGYVNQRHSYIENTLPSIREAFRLGADKVEIDLMVSKDGEIFLFHDEELRCHLGLDKRAPETPWETIRKLDPGFGVTFDKGHSYPLRGTGTKIPLLREVLREFPGKGFLLNPKLYSPILAKNLIELLRAVPRSQRKLFFFWGDERTYREVHQTYPEIDTFLEIPRQHQDCMDAYFEGGWYGIFPEVCENRSYSIGEDRWWMLWDWPFPFLTNARKHNVKVNLWLGNRTKNVHVYETWPLESVTVSNIDLQK